ncbi:P-loop containing nucleoside triphosphate hydrolase protein, partial [Blyttiomyces helicus]
RPKWDSTTTGEQLRLMERNSFLEWRRGLVALEEDEGLLLTPFERNLEVWRQLWRVIERSDLVVQIVDSRHPLFFRSTDLEAYVKEVDVRKGNLLLVNKADMLTVDQRIAWADYFEKEGIRYIFFSAALAKIKLDEAAAEERDREELDNFRLDEDEEEDVAEEDVEDEEEDSEEKEEECPENARIIDVHELTEFLQRECPKSLRTDIPNPKVTIGFVGYPNVGKSSTLNALVGANAVSVSSTPGKTKHFQTIHLSDSIILCDCPGLVFPSFATTKAEMVCNGVLPIDQLREFTGPAGLVAERIPRRVLEAIYGIRLRTRDIEGDIVERQPTAEELLKTYAVARGYTKASQGNPDEARAARY